MDKWFSQFCIRVEYECIFKKITLLKYSYRSNCHFYILKLGFASSELKYVLQN